MCMHCRLVGVLSATNSLLYSRIAVFVKLSYEMETLLLAISRSVSLYQFLVVGVPLH
jgi:hypothetical protein